MPDTMMQPETMGAPRNRSMEIDQLATALAQAQGVIEGAKKDAENPGFKRDGKNSTYADLASVWDAIREPLTKNGLSVMQWPRTVEGGVEIDTVLAHASGQWMSSTLWMPVGQTMTVHTVGSAITYGRRYALMAVVGVAPVDDDGNAAAEAGGSSHKPGPSGSASGGGQFKGERRGPVNMVKEAEKDGLVDTTRNKGEMPGKAAAPGKKSAADKAKEWTNSAIGTIKLPGQHVESLDRWWKENSKVPEGSKFSPLGWLEEAAPEEYERLQAKFEEVRGAAKQVAA